MKMESKNMTQQERIESGLPQFEKEAVVYTLPAYWASYLINGDASGMPASDLQACHAFLESHCLPMPVSCSDESWFSWTNDSGNGLGGDVLEFTFLTQP